MRKLALYAIASGILCCGAIGCASQQLIRCPLSETDLRKEILTIAPLGTPREVAARKLAAAGIRGSFGKDSKIGPDYYCCHAWQRSGTNAWRISMMLHFDKSGKLVEMLELPDFDSSDVAKATKSARHAS